MRHRLPKPKTIPPQTPSQINPTGFKTPEGSAMKDHTTDPGTGSVVAPGEPLTAHPSQQTIANTRNRCLSNPQRS